MCVVSLISTLCCSDSPVTFPLTICEREGHVLIEGPHGVTFADITDDNFESVLMQDLSDGLADAISRPARETRGVTACPIFKSNQAIQLTQ